VKPARREGGRRRRAQSGIRGALDELGLTDPLTGKRPVRKKPLTVKAALANDAACGFYTRQLHETAAYQSASTSRFGYC